MKMKIVLMMLVAMFATAQAELLTNPGFEDGSGTMPDGWSYTSGYGGYAWLPTAGVGGGKAIQISYTTSATGYFWIGQYVPVTAGETYTFSVWAKSAVQGTPIGASAYVTWMDVSYSSLDGGWYSAATSAGDTWAEYTLGDPTVAPEGAAWAAFWLCGYADGWLVDDASFIPEPVTFSLLGLGVLMLRRRKK